MRQTARGQVALCSNFLDDDDCPVGHGSGKLDCVPWKVEDCQQGTAGQRRGADVHSKPALPAGRGKVPFSLPVIGFKHQTDRGGVSLSPPSKWESLPPECRRRGRPPKPSLTTQSRPWFIQAPQQFLQAAGLRLAFDSLTKPALLENLPTADSGGRQCRESHHSTP